MSYTPAPLPRTKFRVHVWLKPEGFFSRKMKHLVLEGTQDPEEFLKDVAKVGVLTYDYEFYPWARVNEVTTEIIGFE